MPGVHAEGMQFPSFANPEFLFLTPLAPAIAWWWVRRPRPAMRFGDTSLFAGSRGWRARSAMWGGATLRGLACMTLILACSGPRLPDLRTRLPADAIAIMMIVDISDSMRDPVPWPGGPEVSRLEAARRAFKLFVLGGESPDGTTFQAHSSDQIGLVALANVPETLCPLTLNHSVLLKVLDGLKPVPPSENAGTNVGDAIAEAVIRLDASSGAKTKVLVLLSDGQHQQLRDAILKPRQAAQHAANLSLKIYTIDAGPDPGATPPAEVEERRRGRDNLRAVAEMTGGRMFTAPNGIDMLAAYKEIDMLERTSVSAPQYRRYFEFYWWCSAAAVVLILLTHMLERTLWRTVP